MMNSDKFYSAKVTAVREETSMQIVDVLLMSGNEKGQTQTIEHGPFPPLNETQKVSEGEQVVLVKSYGGPSEFEYHIYDTYRLPAIAWISILFFLFVIFLGRKKGFFAIIGLLFSIFVLIQFIIPQIISGSNPLLVTLGGGIMIALVSLYLAHGINRKTSLALASTIFTLFIATLLSVLFVSLAKLTGIGTEEAFYLQLGLETLNAKGLLLGGIIIGTLGVLDDITVTQVAIVNELHHANSSLSRRELFRRALSVGKEHIASLVNTLALAYAGAAFPLLLLFSIDQDVPMWVNLNNEFIVEEIIRTLVGSTALLFAVPISTFLAARFLHKHA